MVCEYVETVRGQNPIISAFPRVELTTKYWSLNKSVTEEVVRMLDAVTIATTAKVQLLLIPTTELSASDL